MTKIESVTANARRNVLKDGTRMDGIIKETLSNTAFSSTVPSVVIQDAEEEEISDNEKKWWRKLFWYVRILVMLSLIRLILYFKYLFYLV